MAATITKTQLDGMISERIEAQFGLTPEQLKEKFAELDRVSKAEDKVQRQFTTDLMYADVDTKYLNQAKGVIHADQHKGLGLRFGRWVRACAQAKLAGCRPEEVAQQWGDTWLAEDIEKSYEDGQARRKALGATTGIAAGGAIVPDEYVNELIELLRSRTVVREAGARVVPMTRGTLTMPRQTGAATASYIAEGDNITTTDQTFGQEQMVARKLGAATAVSNDLLRESDPSADAIVRDDLVAVMARRQDLAFLRNDGTQNTPRGILNWVVAANSNASAGTSIANITTDLFNCLEQVEGADVDLDRPAWFFTVRTKYALMSLLNANSIPVFRDEMLRGTLLGYPYFTTSQIPNNLGGGSDESEIYFVETTQAIIADTLSMEMEVFPGGTYHDGAALVSGIATDQTVVRAIALHDFMLRHPEAASIVTGVQYTP